MEAHLAERPPADPGSATRRFSSSNSSQGTPSGVQWICPMKLKKSVRGAPATDDGQAISRRAGEGDGRGQPGGGVKGPEREGERGAMGTGVRGMLRWRWSTRRFPRARSRVHSMRLDRERGVAARGQVGAGFWAWPDGATVWDG